MRICAALPLCAAVLGIGGCGSPARVEKDIAPLTATVTSAGSVVYSPNVYSLDVTTTNLAEVDSDRLVFPGSGTHGIANRRAGDILVSALGGTTHFLRRVLSVTRTSTSLVVMTEPAAVTDAVQQANLQFQIPAVAVPAAAGPTGGLFGGVVDFAFAESWQCASGMFSCQLSDGMKLTPRILSGSYFAPNVYIDAQINIFNNNPVLLKFVVNAMPDAELKMGINIQGKGSYRVEGLLFETPDVLIPIGEVPTYANGQIVVGVEGEIYAPSVDVALDAGFQAGLSAGFEIDNGGAPQGIWSGGTFTPTFKAAFVGIGGEVRARRYVAAKVSWMVGIDKVLSAGPQLTVRKYWQARWYADSMTGFFEQDSSGHDVTVTGAVKEFGIQQSLSLKLADWTDDSQTTQFTGPFVVYPCIVANDGDYCGGENLKGFRLGTVGDLYHCTGGNVTSDVRCQYGCGPATGIDAIEGKRVACNPAPNNPCHSAADGNYCGNEDVNGFNGGTLGLPASALVTCATGLVSHEMTCSGGCGPVSGGARVGCLTPFTRPSAPCGTGDLAGPNNGTCGPDGRVYYCYQGTW